ncbi:hypothetical protein D3C80_1357700 [compost metagenome]
MFAARVTSPFASTLNGPDESTITTVLVEVTNTPSKVSFVFTFPIVADVDPEDFVPKSSSFAHKIDLITKLTSPEEHPLEYTEIV